MEFNLEIIIIISTILLFASIIHGSIGFGFPMIATPLLAIFIDIQSAIILSLIPTILVNLVSIMSEGGFLMAFRRHLPLALLAMLGSGIGTLILISSDSIIFKLILAFAILAYLIADKVKINVSWINRYPKPAKILFGISAGILGGMTNVMAPILIIYSLESNYTKKELIQASNLCFLLGKITQLFLFSMSSISIISEITFSSAMLFIISLGLYLGIKIKKKINEHFYRNILQLLLLVLASILITQTMV